ncbi:outer membrane protein [Methylobacterium segetis]|uniref:outer membrane protein n=1 Tax=Methylobacterium segetis TaxID=2488750 RepID=UPI00104FE743|nr:porin family protein [Methylobacterium segetis]
MKKLLSTFAAFTALTAAASAADLPRRAAPPIFTPVPVFTWTGFYAGFNAGYAFDAGNTNLNGFTQTANNPVTLTGPGGAAVPAAILPLNATLAYRNAERDGFTGGGQIGYNYQFTPGAGVVVGIEADAQYLDFGARRNNAFTTNAAVINPNFVPVNGVLSTLDFFGTVRGRIGYAFDRVLFYGTGGFAYASGDSRLNQFANVARGSDFLTGWAAGGGVEYALPTDSFLNFFRSSAVTLKVEGLYVNLDRGRGTVLPVVGGLQTAGGLVPVYNQFGTVRRDTEFAVVRAGLNYKFGTY